MLKNPFIVKKTRYTHDDEDFDFTNKNLRTHFKNVYIYCKFNNNVEYTKILEGNIEYNDFKNITKSFTLYETDISLIYNEKINTNIIIIDSEVLKDSNYFGYNLPEQILVIPIFNISFLNIQSHIDNITSNKNTFNRFYNELIISDFMNYDINIKKIRYIIKLIKELNIDDYWKKTINTMININKEFNSRAFDYVKNKDSGIISSAMAKINKNVDYFDDILEKSSKMIKKSDDDLRYKRQYYYSKNGSGYTNEEINGIFDFFINKIDGDDLSSPINIEILKLIGCLYNKLLKSKDYCHHIINNEKLLKNKYVNHIFYMKKLVFKNIINYILNFKYAWTRFYMDEISKEGFLNTSDEIVFDIHTASKLPYFKTSYDRNPYISIPINRNNFNYNIYAIDTKMYLSDNKTTGVVDFNTFKENINIFISGCNEFDIFAGIDFNKYKMAISGSIMPACLQKNNPLRLKFNSDYRYYSEYYCNSDVDIMIKTQDYNEFLNIVKNISSLMSNNVFNYFQYDNFNVNYNTNIYVYITKKFISENLSEFDYEYVKSNINSDIIVKKLLPFIIKEHDNYINSLSIDDDNIHLINKFDKSRVNIILYQNNKETFNDISIKLNLKAFLSSTYLSRVFELFMINRNDFMNVVSKFHLPCVRAYYNGSNVYMTPSCISAYMTLMNLHYKYFAGKVCPMEIINKYRMRGYGIILNKQEINELFKYSCDTEFWRHLYGFENVNNVNSNFRFFVNSISINKSGFFEPRRKNYAFYLDNDYVETNYICLKTTKSYPNNPSIILFNSTLINILDKFSVENIYFINGNLHKMNDIIDNEITKPEQNTNTQQEPSQDTIWEDIPQWELPLWDDI